MIEEPASLCSRDNRSVAARCQSLVPGGYQLPHHPMARQSCSVSADPGIPRTPARTADSQRALTLGSAAHELRVRQGDQDRIAQGRSDSSLSGKMRVVPLRG
jgi:hypothetical protein